jgi:excisionase family DNA binding protein
MEDSNSNTGSRDLHSARFESGLMSRKEAAAYLGVSETTLAIWKCTGRYNLKVYKIGRLAKYKKADLDAFIASGMAS